MTVGEDELQKKGVFLPPKPKRDLEPKSLEAHARFSKKKFKREFIVQVGLNSIEKKVIEKKAEANHGSLSQYLRNAGMNYRKGAK